MNEKIIKVLEKNVSLVKESSELTETENLFEVGLDSLTIIDLVVGIEQEFGIKVNDDQMKMENFSSIVNIADFISSYKRDS